MKKITLNITGMHCKSCRMLLEDSIGDLKGVASVNVSVEKGTALIEFDESAVALKQIKQAIEQDDYKVA